MSTNDPITSSELDTIEALVKAATPGEWEAIKADDDSLLVYSPHPIDMTIAAGSPGLVENCEANFKFIARAHRDVPHLIGEIRHLRAAAARHELEAEQLKMAWDSAKADRDRYVAMLDQAMISLAGAGIVTPERGFRGELVIALARHIDELAEQRDEARRQVVLLTHRTQPADPVPANRLHQIADSENPEPRA